MKKVVLIASITASLSANNDYIPFSDLSQKQKVENNFLKIENKIEKKQFVKKSEHKEEIKNNKEIVKEYKNQDILKDEVKISEDSFSENLSITPKLTYSYLRTAGYHSGKIDLVDDKSTLIPELSIAYNKHILKLEAMRTDTYFKKVLIGGGDLDMKTSWYKLNYLYKYKNAKIGLAYNIYEISGNSVNNSSYFSFKDKELFPSLELHLKNEDDKLQLEYGLSYGKSNDVNYSYEYYLNLGYKILKNDKLIISAGYKNKTIDIETNIDSDDSKFKYEGPTISLSSTF